MKKLALIATMMASVALVGCNTITSTADNISKKQSSFSKNPTTIYPTVDGTKDAQPANFTRQAF